MSKRICILDSDPRSGVSHISLLGKWYFAAGRTDPGNLSGNRISDGLRFFGNPHPGSSMDGENKDREDCCPGCRLMPDFGRDWRRADIFACRIDSAGFLQWKTRENRRKKFFLCVLSCPPGGFVRHRTADSDGIKREI